MVRDSELAVYFDDACLDHVLPPGAFELGPDERVAVDEPHPERPERLTNVRHIVAHELGERVEWADVEPATAEQLQLVHDPDYVEMIRAESGGDPTFLTPTTAVVDDTYRAARHAAGASVQTAVRAVESPPSEIPYALVRPGGHHAQPAQADGFCYFNLVAVAAEHVLETRDVDRIAVVDWDVHPGNGTTEIFYDRDDVLVISLHNDFGSWGNSHPQTNRLDELGAGDGKGYTVNVPLPPGTGDEGYAHAFDRVVEPVVSAFDPDLVLVSAGQDPGVVDPTAPNLVTKSGFEEMGRRVRRLAGDHAGGSLGLVQSGGYQLSHLAYATLGVLEGALGYETGVKDPFAVLSGLDAPPREWIDSAVAAYADYWPV